MDYVDLHLHSNCSDGANRPEQVVQRAVRKRITAIALTDHDTVHGVDAAAHAAHEAGIGFLTGTEISAQFEGRELHIVGLGIDCNCPILLSALEKLRQSRASRADKILARLQELGIEISPERVYARAVSGNVGRMHIATELVEMKLVRTPQEGFDRYLNRNGAAYVPKATLAAEEAIDAIHAAHGLAFIAHPGLSRDTRRALPQLLELPFDGIEAYHISHSLQRTQEFLALAKQRQLLITGGSDCHGGIKGREEMGKVRTPVAYYEKICAALADV